MKSGASREISLTQVGLKVGVHIHVFAPLHHTLEDGHQTLQAFLAQTQLLQGIAEQREFVSSVPSPVPSAETDRYLQRGHPQLLAAPALGDLRQVVDEPLKDVGGVQVTVVVHVDVHHTLGI